MRIAFIDDGICENTFSLSLQIEHYRVTPDLCVKKSLATPKQGLSHGTLCAAIFDDIYQNNPNPVLDIAILDDTGKAEISRLVAALEWCLANSVKLIHMSLGTINYFDIRKLDNIIDTLNSRQVILIAAFHNKYIKSYPAAFSGVFGVRRSKKENRLRNGSIALDLCEGLHIENCFVTNYDKTLYTRKGKKIETDYSNSLAAPVLTAIIAKYLNENQTASFSDVMDHLTRNCSKINGCAVQIETYIRKGKENTQKPVVALLSENKKIFIDLLQAFIEADFSVSAISEENENAIPIHHYLKKKEKINRNFLYTLDYIYDPDLIILCVSKTRLDWPLNWDVIDIYIYYMNAHYILQTQDRSFQLNTLQETVHCVCAYFKN